MIRIMFGRFGAAECVRDAASGAAAAACKNDLRVIVLIALSPSISRLIDRE